MDRTSAPNNVSGAYVDDNSTLGITGTLLIADDRNAIQEELVGTIEGAGLTPSAANNGQLLAALQKGAGSTFDADKLDGQHGSYYRDAGNLNAGTIPQARIAASDVLTLIKTVDGSGSGLDADLWDGQSQAQMVLQYVYPVGIYYTQYPDAASNTDSVEFPAAQRPASLFGGTWVEQWASESIFFRTRGTPSDDGRTDGLQLDQYQEHWHVNYDTTASGSNPQSTAFADKGNTPTGTAGYYTRESITDGVHGTPRSGDETRSINRRIKVWKRTA